MLCHSRPSLVGGWRLSVRGASLIAAAAKRSEAGASSAAVAAGMIANVTNVISETSIGAHSGNGGDSVASDSSSVAAAAVLLATAAGSCTDASAPSVEATVIEIDLSQYSTCGALEALGGDALKAALARHGLKCGGTVAQRAERLFLLKSTALADIDKKHFAK